MKIFNWVQRRFTHKDGLGQELGVKRNDEHEKIVNAGLVEFDGWKGGVGVLSIGTFGYDPLMKDDFEYEEEVCDEEVEEMKPLITAAYQHDYDVKESLLNHGVVEIEIEIEEEEINGNRERTTLAQLFSQDKKQPQPQPIIASKAPELINNNNKLDRKTSLANKRGDQDAAARPPIRKLHRLVRRMLKRKIHPDAGSVNKHITTSVALHTSTTAQSATSILSTQPQDAIVKLDG